MKLGKGLCIVVLGVSFWCSLATAQIICVDGSSCQSNFVPVFASNGGNATVTDSIIQQSGSTVTVNGNLSATTFQIGGSLFALGSTSAANAFFGFAGNSGATGSGNLGAGYEALAAENSSNNNTGVGAYALRENNSGSFNTAMGNGALYDTTSGELNTAIGESAGSAQSTGSPGNVTGNANTFIGALTTADANNLLNATVIGYQAHTAESNTLVLGGTSYNAVTVAIGTASPYLDYALDVDTTGDSYGVINGGVVVNASGGNLYLGMTKGSHKFRVDTNGAVYADGGLNSNGADFAESVAVRGERSQYEPGDVLEIDQSARRQLALSSRPYATLVAGIYSTKPGVLASPHHIDDESSHSTEVPLAVVGIVPCKVTAENGPIVAGDLLVTSSTPGYAMKGSNRQRMLGAVLGKALGPLPLGKSKGVIEVLVTLQ